MNLFNFTHASKKKLSPSFLLSQLIIPQADGNCPFLPKSRRRCERIMEVKKLPTLTRLLVTSFIGHFFSKSYSMVMKVPKILLHLCTLKFVLRWILLQLQTKGCCKRKGVVISLCFLWKLLPFIIKRFYNLLYNPICDLLCLLSYWKSINTATHKLIMVKWKKIKNWI